MSERKTMNRGKEFTSNIIDKYNKVKGFYALKDANNNVLYIGISNDLSKRILTHIVNMQMGDDFYSDVAYISTAKKRKDSTSLPNELGIIEMYLIETFNPINNKLKFPFEHWFNSLPIEKIDIEQYKAIGNNAIKLLKDTESIDLMSFNIIEETEEDKLSKIASRI